MITMNQTLDGLFNYDCTSCGAYLHRIDPLVNVDDRRWHRVGCDAKLSTQDYAQRIERSVDAAWEINRT